MGHEAGEARQATPSVLLLADVAEKQDGATARNRCALDVDEHVTARHRDAQQHPATQRGRVGHDLWPLLDVERLTLLVTWLGEPPPLVQRPLDEAAPEEAQCRAIAVRAPQRAVVHNERLRDGLGHLLEPGTLALCLGEGVVQLLARLLERRAAGRCHARGLAARREDPAPPRRARSRSVEPGR